MNILKITDGTTTINFSRGDDIKLIAYEPLTSLTENDVRESAQVTFTSTNSSTNTNNVRRINLLFEQARNYAKTQTGSRVYMEFDPGISGTAWRSLVKTGRVVLDNETLGVLYPTVLRMIIEWTRQPFWEGGLTQLPLTNSSATNDIAGITITNCNDAGTCQVDTATVVGTIDPAGAGNADFVLTAAGMTGSPITTSVALANNDTPVISAPKAVTAMNLDSDITDLFNISSDGADIIVTRLIPAADDATLNLAYDNDTCTGLTPDATSTDTTAGSVTPHENFVTIRDIDVEGDLPAPVKVQMYNSKNGSDAADEVWIHHNVYSNPASLDTFLEGEEATGGTVTDIADGTSCADFYADLAYEATTETLIATWALSTTELSYMAGGRFGTIARWAQAFPYSDMWLRLKLTATTTDTVLWEGNLSLIPDTRRLHQLDVFRLPPYLAGQPALKGINLGLYALRNQAGVHSLQLDYLQFSPISGDDGWKRFVSVETGTAGVAYQEYLIHDDTEGFTYLVDTSSKKIAEFTEYGGPILLIPNAAQKLQFLSVDFNGLAKTDQTWTVKVWYRPRRNSL